MSASADVLTPGLLRGWRVPDPDGSAGKHGRGTILVVGGSLRVPGAALLAGVAALRAGAGRLQMALPRPTAVPVAVAVPEAMVCGLDCDSDGVLTDGAAPTVVDLLDRVDAVLVGSGLEGPDAVTALLDRVLPQLPAGVSVVLDALALGCLPRVAAGGALAGRAVLTPNGTEVSWLLGREGAPVADVPAATREVAARYGAVVSCEGTVAAPDGRAWRDDTGHAGLGTSGSGDVLAGVVAGLLARGATPDQAACWGTFLHGTAGDRLASRVGPLGFLAREIADEAAVVAAELRA